MNENFHYPAVRALRQILAGENISPTKVSLVGVRIARVSRKAHRVTRILSRPEKAKGAIIADGIRIHLPLDGRISRLLRALRAAVHEEGPHFGVHWHSEPVVTKKGAASKRRASADSHSVILYSTRLPLEGVTENALRAFRRHLLK